MSATLTASPVPALHPLLDELDRHLGDELLLHRLGDPFGAVPDDDDDAFQRQLRERVDDVQHHRPPAQRVEHLRRVGTHARAFAGGEDDGGERSVLVHRLHRILGLGSCDGLPPLAARTLLGGEGSNLD